MENVTHSLIGVVLGEGILRAHSLRARQTPSAIGAGGVADPVASERVRVGVLWAAVLGSNAPDGDFVLRWIVGGGQLGNLLHHRGFTHTIVASFPLALLAAAIGRWIAGRGSQAVDTDKSSPAWSLLGLAGWIGVLCHIGADFWNDYGVHPFWPFENRWFYGDFIFIVEPLLWLSLLPYVIRNARSYLARGGCAVMGLAMLALAWSGRFMPWPVALWITLWGAAWSAFHARVRSVGFAFAAILSVLVVFAVSGQCVKQGILRLVPKDESVLQLSVSPAPANPLCWRVTLTTRKAQASGVPPSDYTARQGVFVFHPGGLGTPKGPLPHFAPNQPSLCSPRIMGENDALDFQVEAPSLFSSSIQWAGEFRGNLREFQNAVENHCRARALLRFVRTPFWQMSRDGRMIVGDLRFHSGQRLGFADIDSSPGEDCYALEPPWGMPSGLLSAGK